LQHELDRLQQVFERHSWALPPELGPAELSGDPAAATPLGELPELSRRNRELLADHERLRARLCAATLVLSERWPSPPTARSRASMKDGRRQSRRQSKGDRSTHEMPPSLKGPESPMAARKLLADKESCTLTKRHSGFSSVDGHSEDESASRVPSANVLPNFVGEDDARERRLSRKASSAEEEDDDNELHEPPKPMLRKRGLGISAEAYGAWNNRRAAFVPPSHRKSEEHRLALMGSFKACPLFQHVPDQVLEVVVNAMPLEKVAPGTRILQQGAYGDCLFVILSGAVECFDESGPMPRFICTIPRGRIFGELAMLHSTPRKLSVFTSTDQECVVCKLGRSVYQNLIVRHQMQVREARESVLQKVRCLDMMSSEQVTQLADTLELTVYEEGEVILRQGEPGDEFFIVQSGECSATVETGPTSDDGNSDVQEHRRYYAGDLFGERALLHRTQRAATITAMDRTAVLSMTRSKFERMFGPLSLLQKQNYKVDPRMSIAEFYMSGDSQGPRGACLKQDPIFDVDTVPEEERTDWFAVYRPTSREAIAKMLAGDAVGKGLNVKGKSAKRGRISGFVPFLQISLNAHKELLENPRPEARVRIFYRSEQDRERMLRRFEPLLDPDKGVHIIGDRAIFYLDKWPGVYGLDIPETILREVYINAPDITPLSGWETGRKSEPAFMDMNLAGLRSASEPKIVLYQSDAEDPLNPHGLLIAYAEATVKPVVSDFDTFLVGHRNFACASLPPEQAELGLWTLQNTQAILEDPRPGSWTTRWLEVLKNASQEGFYPRIPKYGFGDAKSYSLIKDVIEATISTGAVRHGAECFNYFFPQELDDEYLVVWSGFSQEKPWEYVDEDELRDFLVQRINEGFTFPINPVWIIRDIGWSEIYEAMLSTEEGRQSLEAYFPPSSGMSAKLAEILEAFPEGFLPNGTGVGSCTRKSLALDMDGGERADLAMSAITTASIAKVKCFAKTFARIKMTQKFMAAVCMNGNDDPGAEDSEEEASVSWNGSETGDTAEKVPVMGMDERN